MKFKTAVATAAIITMLSGTVLASPTLSRNSRGEDVLTLQKKLYLIGYDITELDGVYGKETERAVAAFQHDHKISVTGIVTNVTWRALKKAKEKKGRRLPLPKVTSTTVDTTKSTTLAPYGRSFITGTQGKQIVSTAQTLMGIPYVFGGTTTSGFDCSGLVQYVFKMHGLTIPRLADEQYNLGKAAKPNQLKAGDLVFFTTYEAGVSHCGIYIGDGKFLHASSSKGVRIDSLDNDYWKTRFVGARKVVHD
ncbi:MAG: C40 family peptidase [Selenomonadaceae bacterium]|nr:C40 family peptidase [Selenomonadaceae bacterium]MBQ6132126.1 C40 family peptidase [Selenomonadaceae bacterium]MBQ7493202.1 C40 family peptidase [Selenomonadaceae bacterium]